MFESRFGGNTHEVEGGGSAPLPDAATGRLALIAHELRTPVACIRNAVGIARRLLDGDAPAPAHAALEVIERQSRQLATLLDDLFDHCRDRLVGFELALEPVEVGDIARGVCESMRPKAQAARVELVCHTDASRWVRGHAHRLEQVLMNLVDNAIKFGRDGGEVRVTVEGDAESVTLRVVDDGAGIAPDDLAHVFSPFVQPGSKASSRREGIGLGLAVVESIVREHGGSVSIVSDGPGRGTEVAVHLQALC